VPIPKNVPIRQNSQRCVFEGGCILTAIQTSGRVNFGFRHQLMGARRWISFLRLGILAFLFCILSGFISVSSNAILLAQDLQQLAEPSNPIESLEYRLRETEARLKQLESSISNSYAPQVEISNTQGDRNTIEPLQEAEGPYYLSFGQEDNKKDKSVEEKASEKPSEKKDDKKTDKKKSWYEKYTIRGYAQFRFNETLNLQDGSYPGYLPGDNSVGDNTSFLLRRARLIISGDVSEHLGIYLQPDFAAFIPGVSDQIKYVQIRDWYSDLYLDTGKVNRIRIGQSKIPYGWENMQSSSNRLSLDRNDAFNSAARNERDLGVFYYWTPKPAQDFFKYTVDEGLKGSGNYGIFGFGAYNGQGGSFREQNSTWLLALPCQEV